MTQWEHSAVRTFVFFLYLARGQDTHRRPVHLQDQLLAGAVVLIIIIIIIISSPSGGAAGV